LTLLLTGCTNTIDTVTREYRNSNNEVLDAVMVVTNDEKAKEMHTRVFKHLMGRYEGIDERLKQIKANRTRAEFAKEVLESEGAHLYISELEVNCQRYSLEVTRLRSLIKHYVDERRQERIAAGEDDPVINEAEVCPGLFQLFKAGGVVDILGKQLTKPKLVDEYMRQFPDWEKDVKNLPALVKNFTAKREIFAPKKIYPLVD
jgi:hypothetical protein